MSYPYKITDSISINDDRLSELMYRIAGEQPESFKVDSSNYEWDERGMGELFAHVYRDEIAYCPEWKRWVVYKDGVWKKDEDAVFTSGKLIEFSRLMDLYALSIKDDDVRPKYQTFLKKMADRRFRDRVLKDARDISVITADRFDADPYLINCKNGTYDLKTFTFRHAKYDDYITLQTNFSFSVKDVKCNRWLEFIDQVTQGDKVKAKYLQKALGYSLLGMSNEECMFILHGKTTRNGKSTLLNTIETMLGSYAGVSPVSLICTTNYAQNDGSNATPLVAALKGLRFVTMSESNEAGRLDEEKIKLYTGGENISARALYQAPITFVPQFTMWLSCNDLPAVTDRTLFSSNRIRVIEFNRHFTSNEQDKNLKNEFMTQEAREGVFSWLIRGYKLYLKEGLEMPESIEKVVQEYSKANDTILQFLEEKFQKDVNQNSDVMSIYKVYRAWTKNMGIYRKSALKMAEEIERHPEWFTEVTIENGKKMFKGLAQKGVM